MGADHRALIDMCRRHCSAEYARQTAGWLKERYPETAAQWMPELRAIYREKREQERARRAAEVREIERMIRNS